MSGLSGQCLCGAVKYTASGVIKRVSACYCRQCQRQNGGGAFYGIELSGSLAVTESNTLKWYDSSERAQRGFCNMCGSSLFWRLKSDHSQYDISAGTLEDGIPQRLQAHIFVDCRAPYQTIPADAPHFTEAELVIGQGDRP